jgi:hypothetical protein
MPKAWSTAQPHGKCLGAFHDQAAVDFRSPIILVMNTSIAEIPLFPFPFKGLNIHMNKPSRHFPGLYLLLCTPVPQLPRAVSRPGLRIEDLREDQRGRTVTQGTCERQVHTRADRIGGQHGRLSTLRASTRDNTRPAADLA